MSEHQHEQHEEHDEAFWDARYRSAHALWSGNPNRHLVAEAADLPPGRALDAGAGEGADAIWLARRGWQVTAVDISGVALERAAGHAAQAGDGVPERIQWLREDFLEWRPPEGAYDLVTAQYLHVPAEGRRMLFARLAAAVAAGGTLLIVGHHPLDLETTMPRPRQPELFFTGDDLEKDLGGDSVGSRGTTPAPPIGGWEIITSTAAPHEATDPEGRPVVIHDTVFRMRRA